MTMRHLTSWAAPSVVNRWTSEQLPAASSVRFRDERWWTRILVALVLSVAEFGCTPQSSAAAAAAAKTASATESSSEATVQAHSLTIYGYNYTDTGIGSFEVNGQGGGNLIVSTPTAGGGSGVCCINVYSPFLEPRTIKIKWTRDLDTWCEQEVILKPPLPAKPEYFEVHFYRDGHIEVAVTEIDSPPRLLLKATDRGSRNLDEKKNVNNDAKFARCKHGYR
jgi:Protein of unknown function (DUF3304)